MPFEERVKNGNVPLIFLEKYCQQHKLFYKRIVDPKVFDLYKSDNDTVEFFKRIDRKVGDIFIERYKIDVKSNYVSLKSISDFIGDYFFIFNTALECFIFKPSDLRNLPKNRAIHIPSGNLGFSLDQLLNLNIHTTLNSLFE